MNAKDAIRSNFNLSNMVWQSYVQDLTDEEMLERPVPNINHVKWQLGHLISSEHGLLSAICPGTAADLPAGFADRYTNDTAGSDDAATFDSKEELLTVFETQRAATLKALDDMPEEQLGAIAPDSLQRVCKTIGDVWILMGGHYSMHAGQWAVIRRKLGRPPLF